MSQPLGSFTPRPAQTGDQFQARFAANRPLLVQVTGVDGARAIKDQQSGENITKKAVTINVWDLVGGQISINDQNQPIHGAPNTVYCNVMWMAPAVVDNLEPYVGAPPMPLKVVYLTGKGGRNYLSLVGIEGPELEQVQAVFAADPTRIDREAAAKAQASAAQAAAPAYQQSGFQPMQVQPSAPAQNGWQPSTLSGVPYPHTGSGNVPQPGAPAQQQPMQAPAAAQFQPAPQGGQYPQQPGAVANMPAQVAQQWAPVAQAMDQAQQLVQGGMSVPQAAQQVAQQFAPQGQPQFQQAPPAQPPGIGHVQNSDVANILAGLAGQPPQTQG